jgi:hypothetical protein
MYFTNERPVLTYLLSLLSSKAVPYQWFYKKSKTERFYKTDCAEICHGSPLRKTYLAFTGYERVKLIDDLST